MKTTKIYALLLLFFGGILSSCMEESDFSATWDGLEVEFDASTLPQNGFIASFVRLNETQRDMAQAQINLVAAPQNQAITVNVEVVNTSTAVRGVHYELPSTSVTIPAGQNIAQFPIEVLTGNITPSETPNLVLRITDATGAAVSANYAQVTVRIRVVCPSALADRYDVFWNSIRVGNRQGGISQSFTYDTPTGFGSQVVWTAATGGAGRYLLDDITLGHFDIVYGDPKQAGFVTDVCDVITGDPSNRDQFQDTYTINGRVIDVANNPDFDYLIEITWVNTWGDGGSAILVPGAVPPADGSSTRTEDRLDRSLLLKKG
ncbi:hypothetical protein A3SI_12704 [Nitritalea halalkaliphila LW7]|uniref:DUF4843 domain-containing protein n=1 Tax=Nitritalea halalkaliphila LW7 TaxID=1189621 RepID=I5C1K4_9BACT|nr:DUF4843 domain-containing protein [Nitritalea halalkaliphila]EIM75706.1 hypothetical protein A3SI_12704 [Nitritalea halalkaliphila LW7]